jgi:hypothetical protein
MDQQSNSAIAAQHESSHGEHPLRVLPIRLCDEGANFVDLSKLSIAALPNQGFVVASAFAGVIVCYFDLEGSIKVQKIWPTFCNCAVSPEGKIILYNDILPDVYVWSRKDNQYFFSTGVHTDRVQIERLSRHAHKKFYTIKWISETAFCAQGTDCGKNEWNVYEQNRETGLFLKSAFKMSCEKIAHTDREQIVYEDFLREFNTMRFDCGKDVWTKAILPPCPLREDLTNKIFTVVVIVFEDRIEIWPAEKVFDEDSAQQEREDLLRAFAQMQVGAERS